jgi:hemolysin activation/secretion protein
MYTFAVQMRAALILALSYSVTSQAASPPGTDASATAAISVRGTGALPGESVLIERLRGVIVLPAAEQLDVTLSENSGGVDVSRTPLLDTPAATELIRLFLDKPMSPGSVERLCSGLRTMLRMSGQPFVTVYVPPQEVTDGVLRVVAHRARLDGDLQVEGERWFSERSYRNAVPVTAGAEIDAIGVRASIDRLNRSDYRRVTVAAEPGSQAGTTRLILRAQETRPWDVTAGWNNSGTAVTDENRATLGLKWGNAFGRGDLLGYSFAADPQLEHSRSHSVNYETTFDSGRSFTLFGSWSRIESALPEPLTQQGTSWQSGLRYGVPFSSTAGGWSRSLTLGVDFKYSDNNLEFATIPITDNVTHVAQAGATYSVSHREAQSSTWLAASVYASPGGLTEHNNDETFDVARTGARARYAYGRLDGGYLRQLPHHFSLNLSTTVQVASGALLGTEQLSGGGVSGVRGYRESSAFGDAGVLLRTELHLPRFSLIPQRDGLDAFVFVDRAVLQTRGAGGETFGLGSGGVGLNYRLGRYVALSSAFGWQFRGIETGDRSTHYGHLSASLTF